MPKGWTYELTDKVTLKFNNPEGIAYDGVNEALAHLLQQNCAPPARRKRSYSTTSLHGSPVDGHRFGWFLRSTDKMHFDTKPQSLLTEETGPLEGAVEYLKDASLPSAWSVRTIRSKSKVDQLQVLYKSNNQSFKDKISVAEFLEGMGHPALEIEQLLLNLPSIAKAVPRDHRIGQVSHQHLFKNSPQSSAATSKNFDSGYNFARCVFELYWLYIMTNFDPF